MKFLLKEEKMGTGKKIRNSPVFELSQQVFNRLVLEIPTRFMGKNILFFHELDSTNNYARDLFKTNKEKVEEGTIIFVATQTRGRGQFDRTWHSPPEGGIYFSVLLTPPAALEKTLPVISLMAGAAAATVLEELTETKFTLKYPNDIYLQGKKVGGILVERVGGVSQAGKTLCVVLGMGVNLFTDVNSMPADIQGTASSIYHISGVMINPFDFILKFSVQLEKWYECFLSRNFRGIVECWKERMEEIPEMAWGKLESLEGQNMS